MHTRTALVRRPSPRLAEGLLTHQERVPINVDLAKRQWETYCEELSRHGWRTTEVEPCPESADSVFIEDPVFVYGRTAVAMPMGAPERRAEIPGAAEAVQRLGYRVVTMEPPARMDGGDILKHDSTVWVGVSGRTNREGIAQLDSLLPADVTVSPVELSKVLHLKSAVTALPDGTIIGHAPLLDDPSVFGRFLAVPEETGSHVVLLGGQTVLMAASAPATAEMLASRGLHVVTVDISEFEKLEGCVTCLSVRLRDCPSC